MLAIVCIAIFSTTCPRKPNSIQNVLTNFPARRFELAAKLQTEKLPGHLQNAEYLFVAGFQFREEFLLLQLKMRSSHWRPRSRLFISKRPKCEDAAQRLQRFVHWEVPFEETFHRRVATPWIKTVSVFSKLVKSICDLN
jgi:hypothetical protein